MMLLKLHRDRRGQTFIEMLFVFPLLFMLFSFIVEMGFLVYDWAVLNYQCGTTAVKAATTGQLTSTLRESLAADIISWSANGKDYTYIVDGTGPPGTKDLNTVYIYGTDENTPVQRGQYITISVDYPWHYKFFLTDALASWVVSEKDLRLKVNASVPSEVFIE
ncbi:TadE-like protein [Desulfotomaculum arcticum]|uniref:TadE-like protein n=1 Tax=Desulfotruncus arcticus DSM 17038 TaxID=1121424 RepID=A0A1I2Z7U7_9FIRM|nr:TadE/TadG family type IV pilus assembly protein [Desulfotruncus arcticus]SFH33854.1 TadE-like protein [Desulfotomaculum arcticum] [Desulfotruncus arcticus DSM 17038]